jgi:hypothetical protein
MHALMSKELAEQRRQDLLRQAERARRARKARRARSARGGRGGAPWAWRAATGRVLVRVGVLASGTALEDSMVVVRHRRRPTTIAVIWSDRDASPGAAHVPEPLPAGRGDRSGSRS